MSTRLSPADIVAAATPAGVSLSLSQLNHLVSIGCALLGAAYLLWKWRKEAGKEP